MSVDFDVRGQEEMDISTGRSNVTDRGVVILQEVTP